MAAEDDTGSAVRPPGLVVVGAEEGEALSGESPKSEGRWLWVPPTLILIGFAVFGGAQLLPHGRQPTRAERLLARAAAVCQAHVPPGLSLVASGPMTAGSVAAAARYFHLPPDPWSGLPADHFVVNCSYMDTTATGTSPSTTCRNGANVDLTPATRIVADEDGRTAPDRQTEALIATC